MEQKILELLDRAGNSFLNPVTRPGALATSRLPMLDLEKTAGLENHWETGQRVWDPVIRVEKAKERLQPAVNEFNRELGESINRDFQYGSTKLLLPNRLTLARLYDGDMYPEINLEKVEEAAEVIHLALIDGDIRDAVHDREFDDFLVELGSEDSATAEPEVELGDGTLLYPLDQTNVSEKIATDVRDSAWDIVERKLEPFPDSFAEQRQQAADISEAHQEDDGDIFEELILDGNSAGIKQLYRDGGQVNNQERIDEFLGDEERLDYLETQFERVGVLYDGMFKMYENAGIEHSGEQLVDSDFRKSIVYQIMAAQIWLDDIDDLEEDWEYNQLTPVTAEIMLADNAEEAAEQVIETTNRYFERAIEYAEKSGSEMARIAAKYIKKNNSEKEVRNAVKNKYRSP